jgi:hypothetical protein
MITKKYRIVRSVELWELEEKLFFLWSPVSLHRTFPEAEKHLEWLKANDQAS